MDSTIRGASKELKKLPSATTSVIYFLVMSIMYGFIMIYTTISSDTLSKVSTNSSNQIYTLIYVIFLISGTYFINVGISKSICNENTIQWGTVSSITFLPWIIIFGLLYFLLELFPGWITPFSNTIGYIFVNALGATTTLKDVLKQSSNEEKNTTLKKALENIEKNYSRFINEIDTNQEKFERFIKQLGQESFTRIVGDHTDNPEGLYNNPKVVQLFALVKIKELIGKLFWYILAGTLIASISYNFIINMSCEKTLGQAKKEYSKLYENSDDPVYGKKWLKLSEEPSEMDNQDYTSRLPEFITKFGTHLLNKQDDNNEVTIEGHQLRSIQLSFDELPKNCFIQIDNSYFRPIE
tara:strand:+ start:3278 stop:4336 length:1059 start_codon:yes stop_codon:yes gene_type:complete